MKKILLLFFVGVLLISCGSSQKLNFNDNIVVAHRGAWKAASLPQNSIASLKNAVSMGVHGSEFDIRITADDSLVINHDATHNGKIIEKTSYKDLTLEKLSNGEVLPTLREYLREGLKQRSIKLILEIKTAGTQERTLDLTRKVVALVKEMNAQKLVEYITFDYEAGKLVHILDPEAKIAYLKGDVMPSQAKKDGYTGLDYHFNVYKENPTWISKAHGLGMSINVWTVNSKEKMEAMLAQNVDYITTDEPELLLQLLANYKN